jgi:hypothetical protein
MLSQKQMSMGVCKNIDISKIDVSEYNARDRKLEADNNPDFLEFCDSIKENGLIEPIVVRETSKGEYETIAGSRRLRALKKIGIHQVPTVVRNDLGDLDVRIFSLVENIHRKNLEEDEKMDCLVEIYKNSVDYWKPVELTEAEKLIVTKHGDAELAKSYLKRIHNEISKGYGKAKSSEKAHELITKEREVINWGKEQEIKPTPEFRALAHRVAYAYSTQYNILRGAGSFRSDVDYYTELPPDIQSIIEQQIKRQIEEDKALEEHERLEKEKELKQKTAWKYQVRTKTKKKESPKAQKGRKKMVETKAKKKPTKAQQALSIVQKVIEQDREERKAKEKNDKETGWSVSGTSSKSSSVADKPQKIATSPVRARERIVLLCSELFKLLTGQDLNMNDVPSSERIATSKSAKDNMNELAAFYADSGDRATQQSVVIPMNKAISEYRDILHEAVQKARKQDDILGP